MGKIYTKKGDKGFTFLFNGKKVKKDNLRIEAYGSIDELNSLIGVIVSSLKNKKIKKELINIQQDLFLIGGNLALSLEVKGKNLEKRIGEMELIIDELILKLPDLKNFILPGGGNSASLLHYSRTLCRKTERKVVSLSKKEKVNDLIIAYLNRLSDLLFTMARFVNFKEGRNEVIWKMK